MLRLSLPKPRLRQCKRHARLSFLNLIKELVYYLLGSVAGSSTTSFSSPNVSNSSSPRQSALVYTDYRRFQIAVSQPKALRNKARGYLSDLRLAVCHVESYSFFCFPFSSALNFSRLPQTFPRPLPLTQINSPMPWQSTFLALAWISFFTFSIFPGLYIPFLPFRKHFLFPFIRWESLSRLSYFLLA